MYISPINTISHNQQNTNTNFKSKKLPISEFKTIVTPSGITRVRETDGLMTLGPKTILSNPIALLLLSVSGGLVGTGMATAIQDSK